MITNLLTEIQTGPLSLELATSVSQGNDAEVLNVLNRKDIVVQGELSAHDIRKYLMLYDLLLPIENSTSQSCVVVKRALDIFPIFDLSDPIILSKFTSILDGLVADTLIPAFTIQNKNDILAMSNKKISRLEQLKLTININDIAKALRG